MAVCELCGSEVNTLSPAKIAGTQMKVCHACSRHGKSLDSDAPQAYTFKRKAKAQGTEYDVKENFSSLVNSALAKRDMTVHHLARALNIKESSLSKYTSGKIKPDIETARKIENFLEISLVEEVTATSVDSYMEEESAQAPQSLGDLLKSQLKK